MTLFHGDVSAQGARTLTSGGLSADVQCAVCGGEAEARWGAGMLVERRRMDSVEWPAGGEN
jgi:hypothetical protein